MMFGNNRHHVMYKELIMRCIELEAQGPRSLAFVSRLFQNTVNRFEFTAAKFH